MSAARLAWHEGLVSFRELRSGEPLAQAALALFRAFIEEQARHDPIYGWDGGGDDQLRQTWGGWEHLHLWLAGGWPVGLVSCTTGDHRMLPLRPGAGPVLRRAVTLTNLFVAPAHRRAGHGGRMIRAFLERLGAGPPEVEVGAGNAPADHILAATHGWNLAGQAIFQRSGFDLLLASHAREEAAFLARRAGVEVRHGPAGLEGEGGGIAVREALALDAGLRAELEAAPARGWTGASWYREAFGLGFADKSDPLYGEALYRLERDGALAVLAAFAWSLHTLPRQFVVECLELHAAPGALGDPRVADALHELVYRRLDLVHRAHFGRPIEEKRLILRLPVLAPAADAELRGALERQGLATDLLHYGRTIA